MNKPKGYQICNRCVMDTSDPDIEFDENGICSHCHKYDIISQNLPYSLSSHEKKERLKELLKKIQNNGRGKQYDCVIGLSGGVDSSYLAYLTKREFGLRPLAVHLDNGWNSELAIQNIEHICKKLDIDLQTYVIDWEEFRDIQLAFLYASTPDSEIPTDHAIFTMWRQIPEQIGVMYFLCGSNTATESTSVKAWSQGHSNWNYIKTIHQKFGHKKIKTFPHFTKRDLFKWTKIKGIQVINILDYVDYDKQEAKKILIDELGWTDYGGKHYESLYTKFYQAYILPQKFGYDKRRMHLTSLIHSHQISRDEALQELQKPLYNEQELKEDMQYVLNKLGITEDDFQKIMELPKKTIQDYQEEVENGSDLYSDQIYYLFGEIYNRAMSMILRIIR